MSKRKFYETTVTFKILSDAPIGSPSLRRLDYLTQHENYVLKESDYKPEEITASQMADALYQAGSEPAFFNLDLNGDEIFDPCLACDSVDCTCDDRYTVTAIYSPLESIDETPICSTNNQAEAIDVYNKTINDHYYYLVYLRSKSDPDFNKTHMK